MSLTIIGNNDRALSLATVAKKNGIDVTIVGKYERQLSLPNEVLRQSINWDFVTGLERPKYDAWRMDYFLKANRNYQSQGDIEEDPFIKREVWDKYVSTCVSMLRASGIRFIDKEISQYSTKYIRFIDGSLERHDNVCIALEPTVREQPLYIEQENFDRIIPMMWTHTHPCKLLVIPTGNEDYAMRASMYLREQGHDVTYLLYRSEDIKHSDYGVPGFKEWGYKSALGPYYRDFIRDDGFQDSYLSKIEAFKPSIRREVLKDFRVSGVKTLKYDSLNSLASLKWAIELEDFDYYVDLRKLSVSIKKLPPNDCTLPLREKPQYPLMMEGMRSPNGVYYTGALAERFDGPRQNYMLSAGLTSLEIVEDIVARR